MADAAQARREQAMSVVSRVLQVAEAIRDERFVRGIQRLFDAHGEVCADGVRRVRSNGFLKMAFGSNITPQLVDGICVETCLAGAEKYPTETKTSGLLFDDFLECVARLAVEVFPGVSPEQTAELLMLQLDQTTSCLTRRGPITPQPRLPRSRNGNAEGKKYTAAIARTPETSKARAQAPAAATAAGAGAGAGATATAAADLKVVTGEHESPRKRRPRSPGRSPEQQTQLQQLHYRLLLESPKGKARGQHGHDGTGSVGTGSSSFDGFLERVETDMQHRCEKIERLRARAAPGSARSSRSAQKTAATQAETMARLHNSRQHHFEVNKEKYDKLRNCDSRTGQELFKPALIASSNSLRKIRGAIAAQSRPARSAASDASSQYQDVAEDAENDGARNRFDALYDAAVRKKRSKAERERRKDREATEARNASKVTERSRYYYESRLLRELSNAFLQANDESALAMPAEAFRALLLRLVGAPAAPADEPQAADQEARKVREFDKLVQQIVECLDSEDTGTVAFAAYMSFVKRVVQQDPCSRQSNGAMLLGASLVDDCDESLDSSRETASEFSEQTADVTEEARVLFARFRQLYLANRCYSEAARRQGPKAEHFSFSPQLCARSREIDLERVKHNPEMQEDGLLARRELQLLRRGRLVQEEHHRRRVDAGEREMEECTFKPRISRSAKKTQTGAKAQTSGGRECCGRSQPGDDRTDGLPATEQKLPPEPASAGSAELEEEKDREDEGEAQSTTRKETLRPHRKNVPIPSFMGNTAQSLSYLRGLQMPVPVPKPEPTDFTRPLKPRRASLVRKASDKNSKAAIAHEGDVSVEWEESKGAEQPPTPPRGPATARAPIPGPAEPEQAPAGYASGQARARSRARLEAQAQAQAQALSRSRPLVQVQAPRPPDPESSRPATAPAGELELSFAQWAEELLDAGEDLGAFGQATPEGEPDSPDEEASLLLYVDVQLKGGTQRIAVHESEDPVKIAERFAAIHQLSGEMERRLTEHLRHLIRDHDCCRSTVEH